MKIKTIFIIAALFIGAPSGIFAEQAYQEGDDPGNRLDHYTRYTESRKLHLQFNKNQYSAGDGIWFSAYLLNSVTHLPDTSRTNIYVDLIDADGVLMEKRILLAENGSAEGDISLPLTIPDGNYLIRAYTDRMRNFDEEFYFKRYLYIRNDKYEDIIPRSEVRSNRRFNRNLSRMEEEYDIAFFPEGGELIEGVTNRLAFRAVNALGGGLDAQGVVLDEQGNEIVHFTTVYDGMGNFELIPEPGVSYKASVSFNDSRPVDFEMPAARREGVALRLDREDDNILLTVSSGISNDPQNNIDEVIVIAHTRGKVRYYENMPVTDGTANATIPQDLFPSGIAHFTVFSSNNMPLAERLAFIDRKDSFTIIPQIVKLEHEQQEFLGLQMEITDETGDPVKGNFSVSVLTGDFDFPGSGGNILSNILLTSDLKGVVKNPQHYFDPAKELKDELDLLMMTHGWRRFDWETVLSGNIPEMPHSPSESLSIGGRVTDPAKDQPVSNQTIQLKVLSGHDDVYETTTDGRGMFVFEGLEYPDNYRVELSTNRLPAGHPPEFELFKADVTGYDYTPGIYTREERITQRGSNWSRDSDAGRSPYAESPDQGSTPRRYGIPDQTIFIDRDKVTQRTVYDVLVQRAQGLQVYGNEIMFRGPSSINLSSEPMFMIDGVQSSKGAVLSQNPRDIERIELYRGASAAMFGVRGGAGVIITFTRQAGDRGFQDTREYMMIGYHSPREYYSDILPSATGTSDEEMPVRTIHWEASAFSGDEDDETVYFPYYEDAGKMKIVIEGTGSEGGLGFGEFTIEIR